MKKYAIILAAALLAGAFCGCDDQASLPFIPVEKPDDETPPAGEDPATQVVTYRLDKVLQCAPDNLSGTDIFRKFDFFATVRMTLSQSPTQTTVEFDNGEVPFQPFAEALPEGKIECVLDTNVTPNVLRVKDSGQVIALFLSDGFSTTFQLDSKLLSYQYKFKSL